MLFYLFFLSLFFKLQTICQTICVATRSQINTSKFIRNERNENLPENLKYNFLVPSGDLIHKGSRIEPCLARQI